MHLEMEMRRKVALRCVAFLSFRCRPIDEALSLSLSLSLSRAFDFCVRSKKKGITLTLTRRGGGGGGGGGRRISFASSDCGCIDGAE